MLKQEKVPKISLNFCFLEILEEWIFQGLKNEFELSTVNESSVFEPLMFFGVFIQSLGQVWQGNTMSVYLGQTTVVNLWEY